MLLLCRWPFLMPRSRKKARKWCKNTIVCVNRRDKSICYFIPKWLTSYRNPSFYFIFLFAWTRLQLNIYIYFNVKSIYFVLLATSMSTRPCWRLSGIHVSMFNITHPGQFSTCTCTIEPPGGRGSSGEGKGSMGFSVQQACKLFIFIPSFIFAWSRGFTARSLMKE